MVYREILVIVFAYGCNFVCENWKIILLDKTHGSLDNSFRLLGLRWIYTYIPIFR